MFIQKARVQCIISRFSSISIPFIMSYNRPKKSNTSKGRPANFLFDGIMIKKILNDVWYAFRALILTLTQVQALMFFPHVSFSHFQTDLIKLSRSELTKYKKMFLPSITILGVAGYFFLMRFINSQLKSKAIISDVRTLSKKEVYRLSWCRIQLTYWVEEHILTKLMNFVFVENHFFKHVFFNSNKIH